MGINNINKFLKDKVSSAFCNLPINHFKGKKIAIDGAHWAFTNMAIARKIIVNKTDILHNEINDNDVIKEWFSLCLNFLLLLLSHNITPIIVFDGKNPIEKTDTKSERRESQTNYKNKIDTLKQQLKDTPTKDVAENLKKYMRNYIHILPENFSLFKNVIAGIGIPCIQARGEGEQLCSSLCIDGIVSAVFSADTDNLVYGCPLLLTNFKGGNVCEFESVKIDIILRELNISQKVFIDLCIMSGCDFNTNMYGYGVAKSHTLLKKYGSIDLLPKNLDITCLNHIRCREIFTYISSSQLLLHNYSNTKNLDDIKLDNIKLDDIKLDHEIFNFNNKSLNKSTEYFKMIGLISYINRFTTIYNNFEVSHSLVENNKVPLKLKILPKP